MVPPDVGRPATAALHRAAVPDRPAEKAVDPAVLGGPAVLEVPVGIPVELGGDIQIRRRRPVVADVGDLPAVPRILPDNIVEAEPGNQDPRTAAGSRILEDERKPQHRHIADVEDRRPGHHDGLRDPLHFLGREVIVWLGQVTAGDFPVGSVEPCRARILGQIAAEEPVGGSLLEAGQRIGHHPATNAGVVADPAEAGQDGLLVEQGGIAGRTKEAVRLLIGDRIRLEGGLAPLRAGCAAKVQPSLIRKHCGGVRAEPGGLVALASEQISDDRIIGSEAPPWRGWQSEPSRRGGVDRLGRSGSEGIGHRGIGASGVGARADGLLAARYRGRLLRAHRAGTEQAEKKHGRANTGRRAGEPAPMNEPGTGEADLVQEQDRHRHQHHRQEVGAGGENRAGCRREHDREAAELVQASWSDDPQRGEQHDHQGDLEGEAHGQHDLHHEAEILLEGDQVHQSFGLEAEQDRERLWQQHEKPEGRPAQEHECSREQRRDDQALLLVIEGRGEKTPDLEDDVGRDEDQPGNQRQLERDHDRFGRTGDHQLAASGDQILGDRRLQEVDDLKSLDHPVPDEEAHDQRNQGPHQSLAQFLEVLEEGHLRAGACHRTPSTRVSGRASSGGHEQGPLRRSGDSRA